LIKTTLRITIFVLLLVCPSLLFGQGLSTRVSRVNVSGKMIPVRVVSASFDAYRIKVAIAYDKIGATSSVGSIASQNGAAAAINGTYFDAYTSSPYKPPYNTLITNGVLRNAAGFGTTLGFDSVGNYMLDRVKWSIRNGPRNTATPEFWLSAKEVMGCGPTLVKDGAICLNVRGEGFKDPRIVSASALRSAVGLTANRHIIFITCKGTIRQLAQVMKGLGAIDAMNLDGGDSSALWVRGRYVTGPGRNISNALLLVPIVRTVRSPLPANALMDLSKYDPDLAAEALEKYPQIRLSYQIIADAIGSKQPERLLKIWSQSFKWDVEYQTSGSHKSKMDILDYSRSIAKLSDYLQSGISPRWCFRVMLFKPYDNGHKVAVLAYRSTILPFTPYDPSTGRSSGNVEAVEHIWSLDESDRWELMYERSRLVDQSALWQYKSFPKGAIIGN